MCIRDRSCIDVIVHDLFEQGHNELGFIRQWYFIIVYISLFHVHCIDTHRGGAGHVDHCTAERAYHRRKLIFRVKDQHIIIGGQEDLADLQLCAHGFARARHAKTDAVAVEQHRAVGKDCLLYTSRGV